MGISVYFRNERIKKLGTSKCHLPHRNNPVWPCFYRTVPDRSLQPETSDAQSIVKDSVQFLDDLAKRLDLLPPPPNKVAVTSDWLALACIRTARCLWESRSSSSTGFPADTFDRVAGVKPNSANKLWAWRIASLRMAKRQMSAASPLCRYSTMQLTSPLPRWQSS